MGATSQDQPSASLSSDGEALSHPDTAVPTIEDELRAAGHHTKAVTLAQAIDDLFGPDPYADFRAVDLGPILAGSLKPRQPDMLRRSDGKHLLYSGKRHWFQGEPESGKTWLALVAAAELMLDGKRVVYVDWEDTAEEVCGRLRTLGVGNQILLDNFLYHNPPGSVIKSLDAFRESFALADLVIFDACTEAMVAEGLNPEKNADVELWSQGLPNLARRSGAAYIVIDHVTKAYEGRGRFAIGGGHKLGLTDVAYSFHVNEPVAPGAVGRIGLRVEKDRPGGVRSFALDRKKAATMVVNAESDVILVTMFPPADKGEGPSKLQRDILAKARQDMEPRTKTAMSDLVSGNRASKLEAVEQMIADGMLIKSDTKGAYPKYVPAPEIVPDDEAE